MTEKVKSLKNVFAYTSIGINCTIGNGFITTDVLREILRELDDNLDSEELDNMIDEIDADGSGTVDWEGNSDPYFDRLGLKQHLLQNSKRS